MGRVYDSIDDDLRVWIEAQPLCFVGTAPSGDEGHVNVSPKGGAGTFRVTGPRSFAYLDLTASGIETVAHLRQNRRIVVMFCAFAGPPKIVRLHGWGRVVTEGDPEFAALATEFPVGEETLALARAVIVIEVTRVSDSCGFTVPEMTYAGERPGLVPSAATKRHQRGPGWKATYQAEKNAVSIDGLPGLDGSGSPGTGEVPRPH
ncbi:MAG: hypothetical protein AVDCRST_MAG70-1916 [uncultured Thermomicrobiales bacterium]|uniref:Pyridoxamine 5'-phosphate oxidase N-terminal domain-containing protein n=1 Tax=uncultured Thermomicrobiales bacterium TaxID=1645740 RepID=A0A6J4UYI6_9BACT|nr:MAG: hypothetical protein AVDCRST_MAG70-1916 [uncultured Thermomicrobiales bacterium]